MSNEAKGLSLIVNQDGVPPFQILDDEGKIIDDINLFLRDVYARSGNLNTVRAYAYALLDWYRFIRSRDINPRDVRRSDVVDYILHLRSKVNPQRKLRRPHESGNGATGKKYLPQKYQASTINARLTAISLFYDTVCYNDRDFKIHPLGNHRLSSRTPIGGMVRHGRTGRSLLQRGEYRLAHALSKSLVGRFKESANCTRDLALIEGLYCTAARASEILSLSIEDILWSDHKVMLKTKGQKGKQPVVVSTQFLVLLESYLGERVTTASGDEPVWLMRRGEKRPMTYSALRAVIRRINEELNTNVCAHDFRATCATHLAQNPDIPFIAIKSHMRHSNSSSTQRYMESGRSESSRPLRDHFDLYIREEAQAKASPAYNRDDLEILLNPRVKKL
ncbi:site-specific recombinase XerD [Deinococcus sp. HSC-46F16]|uniref:tyrosine-type recombinase/integrase n=1 Tax=Deinococcus sp. HSC-46F16 TaxID=2910968 RepID=UPI00209EC480|nr:site-specific integrase [Deinococcus sp. HSC-46F16]MCP2014034.1 site-specific recombinase XerD [Deinococcus sp. HSC-46F16]